MSEAKTASGWWQTLPGMLTGLAAVLTAVGGLIAVLHQSGYVGKDSPRHATAAPHTPPNPASPAAAPDVAVPPATVAPPVASATEVPAGQANTVRAGHYLFKLLKTEQTPYSTGKDGRPQKLAVRLFIRITDTMGMSDYVDRTTIRLSADGAELIPENSISVAVYERASAETEALFIVPADASSLTVLLGRQQDGVATLPLHLNGSH